MIIHYTICILPSLYYILVDLDLKSNHTINETIKNLSNIIYYSNLSQFTQIFLGKYCLNLVFYYVNKLTINHVIIFLSKTTDIIFVKILEKILIEFDNIFIIPIYFPLKYLLKFIGIAFWCISKRNIIGFGILHLILNIISLVIIIIPFYLLFVCFENDSKKILFMEIPIIIYSLFNMWLCGKVINEIEENHI